MRNKKNSNFAKAKFIHVNELLAMLYYREPHFSSYVCLEPFVPRGFVLRNISEFTFNFNFSTSLFI